MITQPTSSGPSSPRLILNSPPLDSPPSLTGNTSYFQPPAPHSIGKPSSKCPVPGPKPLYPPGQGPSTPSKNKPRPQPQAKGRTPAEVYANQHTALQNTSKRQLPIPTIDHHHHTPQKEKEKEKGTKPIFEWISRKLGSRRATISESPSSPSSSSNPNYRFPIPSNGSPKLNGSGGNGNGNTRNRIPSMPKPSTRGKSTRGGTFGMTTHHHQIGRQISNVSSNMDNQSLSMISTQSYVGTLERERRREANNPYPSIPIPKLIATGGLKDTIKRRGTSKSPAPAGDRGREREDDNDGTTISMSFSYSYLSRSPRSRSYSLDSIRSLSRSSYSNSNRRSLDDNISEREKDNTRFRRFRGGRERASTDDTNERPTSGLGIGGTRPGADDDASLRPFPPSHPASPTPSHSVLSRTGSNPIPLATTSIRYDGSVSGAGNRSRTNTFYSTWSGLGGNNGGRARSFTSSSLDGLYGSTYRYSFDQYNDHDGPGSGPQDGDEEDDDERGRQSRQDSTSTKPTTCISFDSTPPIAHIAQPNLQIQTQAQGTPGPSTPHQLQTPVATQNGTFGLGDVITSSPMSQAQADPSVSTSPQYHSRDISSSEESHLTPPTPTTPTSASNVTTPLSPAHPMILPSPSVHVHVHVQAPKHTPHHPVHNPIPSEVPDDNASMLTLASSTFGLLPQPGQGQGQANSINPSESTSASESHTPTIPHHPSDPNTPLIPSSGVLGQPPSINRLKENKRPSYITSPSIHWAPTPNPLDERPTSTYENNSHYPPSTHASILSVKWADRDASVRAVRRKGSWESYESGWSWRDGWGTGTARNVSSPLGEDRPGSWRSREREGDEGVGGVVVVAN
ncbi:hypothetical protein I302_105136 [Kwoniella bestiolae CBS 10118]|uniref:Uncharacterized protein n=1 Tax=Kwoniella bestiolae CBS 10118 TaxID=1296100 RepID=A0A1B9FSA0_9TREE|nr:hypothetical protein I302_08424 [Kwoniella bestiolae CBS 10118]OCF21648.1 hypothetical protein I302_08424 [Kwoniella bestiolae CBS 10118]